MTKLAITLHPHINQASNDTWTLYKLTLVIIAVVLFSILLSSTRAFTSTSAVVLNPPQTNNKYIDGLNEDNQNNKLKSIGIPSIIGLGAQKAGSSSCGLALSNLPEIGNHYLAESPMYIRETPCFSLQ